MENKNQVRKSIALNIKNESDNTILKYSKRRNFSNFAKKAMLFYIEHLQSQKPVEKVIEKKDPIKLTPVQKPKTSERLEQMKKQVKQTSVFKPKLGGF